MNKLPPDIHRMYKKYQDESSPSGNVPPHLATTMPAPVAMATPTAKIQILAGTDEAKKQLTAILPRLSISIDSNGQFYFQGEKSLVATATYYLSLCEWKITPTTPAKLNYSSPTASSLQSQVIKGVLGMINGARQ